MFGQHSSLATRKLNLFPLVVVSWIMVVYLLITENLSWYTWVFVGFLIFERVWLWFSLWLQALMFRELQKRMMDELKKHMEASGPVGPMLPPGLGGGPNDPPQPRA